MQKLRGFLYLCAFFFSANAFAEAGNIGADYLKSINFYQYNQGVESYLPVSKDVADCPNYKQQPVSPVIRNFTNNFGTISNTNACENLKESAEERFTMSNCQLLIACGESKKIKDLSYLNILVDKDAIPKMVAEDYAGLALEKNINEMEKIEFLRKFAEKKYGKDFASTCKSPFEYKSANFCKASFMDAGFSRMQHNCQSGNPACYNSGKDPENEFTAFTSAFKRASEGDSSVSAFFDTRTENNVSLALGEEEKMMQELVGIMSSRHKTSTKTQHFFAKLHALKKTSKLQQFFGFDQADDGFTLKNYKKSPHYDFFSKILSKSMSKENAKAALEKYRMDFAKDRLNQYCPSAPKFVDICRGATQIAGSNVLYLNEDRKNIASRLRAADHFDFFRSQYLKKMYPKGIQSETDFEIVMDAQRCRSFGFDQRDRFSPVLPGGAGNINLSGGQSIFDLSGPSGLSGFNVDSLFGPASNLPDSRGAIAVQRDSSIFKFDAERAKNTPFPDETKAESFEQSTISDEPSLSSSFAESFKNSASKLNPGVSNQMNNSSFTNLAQNQLDEAANTFPEKQISDPKKAASTRPSALDEKISDLTRKLAATEENLEKMKSEKEAEASEKERKRKIEEENATIADLKNQLNELKTQKTNSFENPASKVAETNSQIAARPVDISRAPAFEDTSADEMSAAAHAATEAAHATASNYAVNESASSRSSGGTFPQSVSSMAGSKSGITLTKIDGLSPEKVTETINNKIIELGGQSFEIEENGIKFEIVPEIKDGKILLDKEGNPRYTKKIKTAKEAKDFKARVPASVKDAADLKRVEEEKLKRERAEYLKLKNLTQKALEKN